MADGRITEDADGQPVIQVPLLAELRAIQTAQASGFSELRESMKGKADKADVARLESRLDQHAQKISDIESWRHDRQVASEVHTQRDEQSWSARQKVAAALSGVGLILATVLGPYLANHL